MQPQKRLQPISSLRDAAQSWAAQHPRSLPSIRYPDPCDRCKGTGIAGYSWETGDQFCTCSTGAYMQQRDQRARDEIQAERARQLREQSIGRLEAFSKLHCLDGHVPSFATMRPMVALDKIRDFGAAWDGIRSILLMGRVGRGKTQLLLALVNEVMPQLMARQQTLRLITVPDFMKELRSGFDPERQQAKESYATLMDTYRTCGLLVFDDLGAEKLTDWVQEQFYLLFDYRYRQNLPIWATSNYFFNELGERLDERVHDRIRQSFDLLVVQGPNQRDEAIKTRKVGA